MQKDVIPFDGHSRHWDIGEIAYASAAVELPGVPRADDGVLMQRPMREGSAAMRAVSVHGMERSIDIAHDICSSVCGNLGHASRRQLGHAADANRYHKVTVPCVIRC